MAFAVSMKIESKLVNEDALSEIVSILQTQHGYDFSNYAKASFVRRIERVMDLADLRTVYDLKFQLTNNKEFFAYFLQNITVNVTEMFRDPMFYKDLSEKVIPVLATYPYIKIWHAGCSTGEEVYSLSILLHEAGLLDRCKIYATDLNPLNLEKAKIGILSTKQMREYTQNYLQAGGKSEFSNYYTARYDSVIISKELRKNVVFSQHNLVTDGVFNEFQLICCRNVMIYFNRQLQNRAYNLFYESLSHLGYLAVGAKESLLFAPIKQKFDAVTASSKIFRRLD